MKKICTSLLLAVIFLTTTMAQDRPFRIGLKFGLPQIAGLNVEYVTPLLNKRLAGDLDLSYFSFSVGGGSAGYMNFALGANYYFMNEGRGLYGGICFDRMSFSAKSDWTDLTVGESVSGEASLGINTLDFKLGGKHGGLFYFRWELGYGLALNSADLKFTAKSSTGVEVTKTESLPISGGGIMFDLGFGFSF